ncbi:MAG: hypothetical protein M0Z47_11655 [Actinomycetota bacterium]|nr:hypothetical protein [Actinomycetota bacterium]
MPRRLEVESALSALAHGVETFRDAGRNPVTAPVAEDAARQVYSGLSRLAGGAPPEAVRDAPFYGAFLAEAGPRAGDPEAACRETAALLPINNPRPLSERGIRGLIERAFEGRIAKKAEVAEE